MVTVDDPVAVGLDPRRWRHVRDVARRFCDDDHVPAIGLTVGRGGLRMKTALFGRQQLDESAPLREDALFLVASITKPLVAMAALRLIEQGRLSLGDRVYDYLPEFGKNSKFGITIRHLLTHTSGLPDMLPQNRDLRAAHAPLAAFVDGTCEVGRDFAPGRGVQYQSMGFAVLGELIARVSGTSCAEYLHQEFFAPLRMHDTALGAPDSWFDGPDACVERIAEIRTPPDQEDTDWGWNSRYWRSLGAPWGGLLTTPDDLAHFAQTMLCRGNFEGEQLLSPAAIAAATRNQLEAMRDVPSADRRTRPWGLGWRLQWPAHSANFGDLLGPRTYGHWGATGTLLWIDPQRDAYALVLTTQPQEPRGYYLARLSNAISAALL